jgi:hypothetical protein
MWVLLDDHSWDGELFVGYYDDLRRAKGALPARTWFYSDKGSEWRTEPAADRCNYIIREHELNTPSIEAEVPRAL